MEAQCKFFEQHVFSRESPYSQASIDGLAQADIDESLGACPTFAEFQLAIRKMSPGKASGANGLVIELFQKLDDCNQHIIYESIICPYWTKDDFDVSVWHQVMLKLLPKKGDTSRPKNWRPISLLDVLSKVVSSIIARRLSNYLVKNGLDAQAGFSKHKGCDDALAALKIGLQKLKDHHHDS